MRGKERRGESRLQEGGESKEMKKMYLFGRLVVRIHHIPYFCPPVIY